MREKITFVSNEGVGRMVDALLLAHTHDEVDIAISYDGGMVQLTADVALGNAWEEIGEIENVRDSIR